MHVTEELGEWEDSRNMDRKREWFTIDAALAQLALHKPVQRHYLQQLKSSNLATSVSTAETSTLLLTTTTNSGGIQQQQPQTTSTN